MSDRKDAERYAAAVVNARHDDRCGFHVGYSCDCRPPQQGPRYDHDTIEHRAAEAIANQLNATIDGDDLRHALAAHSLLVVDLDFAEQHLPLAPPPPVPVSESEGGQR